jgi:predicted HTH domain antitoxin
MKSKVVPLRIPENLDELAALNAKEQNTDKATALRQWLHVGAIQYVLKLVAEGRISLERASEVLDLTIYELQHQAEVHSIEMGATEQQRRRSHALMKKLIKQ